MDIRPGVLNDAARIAEIHVAAWQTAYRGLIPDADLDGLSVEGRERFWLDRLSRGEVPVLVASVDDLVVGWVVFGPSRDEDAREDTTEVFGIYLDPGYWGRGIGSALWSEMLRRLREKNQRMLTVWALEANAPARHFYCARGAHPDGAGKRFVRGAVSLPEVRHAMAV